MSGSKCGEGNRTALLFAAILPQEVTWLHEGVSSLGQRDVQPAEELEHAEELGHDLCPNNLVNV